MKTSTLNKLVLAVFLIAFIGSAAASHESSSTKEGFVIPDYESHYELATQLFAPFLFVTVLFQIVLEFLFNKILLPKQNTTSWNSAKYKYKRKRIRRFATVSSLAIAAMLVPTNFYTLLTATALVSYGSAALLFVVVPFLVLFWLLLIKPAGE